MIQIPCLNEAENLPEVIADIPTTIPGISDVEILVIDDGSSDKTQEIARKLGVDYVLVNPSTLGLARSFQRGLETCLALGADIIVNTDGDHQYPGRFISDLIKPIMEQGVDMVIGCRPISEHPEFSKTKKCFRRSAVP